MTPITLDDGNSLITDMRAPDLLAAIGNGNGRIGLPDATTRRWVWIDIARIREIDGQAVR